MIWITHGLMFFLGFCLGLLALGLCQMAREGDACVVRQDPPDESPRPVITPNPRPRVAKR